MSELFAMGQYANESGLEQDQGSMASQGYEHNLDMEYRHKVQYYLMGISGSTVCCLGTIANALSVAVLTRRSMRSSTYTYLTSLAICDSLVLLFTLLITIEDTKPPSGLDQITPMHAILFPYIHPTAFTFQVISIWLTLAFTVDRYIMICHPFRAEHMCRRSRARRVIIGLYLGGLLVNIPKYLEYRTDVDEYKVANGTSVVMYGVVNTEIGTSEWFVKLMHSGSYVIFVAVLPFLTLLVLNTFLIRAVHLSRIRGREINVRERHRNDTTIMLIGVIVIFLICQGPALVSRTLYAKEPRSAKTLNVFTLNEISSFLVILNSAINIVPYYLFGRKFRSEFWRLFCKCFFDSDELRRIARSYSLSVDPRRPSHYNGMEMNGLHREVSAKGPGATLASASFSSSHALTQSHSQDLPLNNRSNSSHRHARQRQPAEEVGEAVTADLEAESGPGEAWINCNGTSWPRSPAISGDNVALPLIHRPATAQEGPVTALPPTPCYSALSATPFLPSAPFSRRESPNTGSVRPRSSQYMTVVAGPRVQEPITADSTPDSGSSHWPGI